ncbi:IclR family transcriptional regulator [Caballeronia sp. LZ035]|uniref:IclR family transcriptional regulator n=1 Tax=Caballeronia sp. LZ035 TaxID=3038568 RepID=UPI002857F2FC|nr:IclR family transcriptional regulator [Caballeronia sp. LZ035]MDR5760621.1 IclR family transcriptional regulator [Caballeronia sp. LZ035]
MSRISNASSSASGAQGLHRAVQILREVSTRERQGARLVDIADALTLERPTAHRILKALLNEGLLRQDADTQRYHLGAQVYELGLCVSPRFHLRDICAPLLARLASETGDSIYLVVRSGFDIVCLSHMEGSFPIRTTTLVGGGRRPLGVGAGSLALLMTFDDAEIDHIIEVNAARFARFGAQTPARLRAAIERSRAQGYAVNDEDVLPGVSAIGMVIAQPGSQPYAAVSIAAISSRMQGERREALAQSLRKEVEAFAPAAAAVAPFWNARDS